MTGIGAGREVGDGGLAEILPGFPDSGVEEGEGSERGVVAGVFRSVADLPVADEFGGVVGVVGAGDPLDRLLCLGTGRRSTEEALVNPVDLGVGIGKFREGGIDGQLCGLLDGERVVEEEECLLGTVVWMRRGAWWSGGGRRS